MAWEDDDRESLISENLRLRNENQRLLDRIDWLRRRLLRQSASIEDNHQIKSAPERPELPCREFEPVPDFAPLTPVNSTYAQRLENIRKVHPRAYNPWSTAEDKQLIAFFKSGKDIMEISGLLQRQSGGIRSRLIKLGLIVLPVNQSSFS